MIERNPKRERDDLAAALKPLMGSINFYMGPNARSAVGQDTVRSYERLSLALCRARGEACPRCNDTGIDRHFSLYGPHPCDLRHEPNHHVPIPPEALAYMIELRDKDRAEDAKPDRRGSRLGPPRYEAELEGLGIA